MTGRPLTLVLPREIIVPEHAPQLARLAFHVKGSATGIAGGDPLPARLSGAYFGMFCGYPEEAAAVPTLYAPEDSALFELLFAWSERGWRLDETIAAIHFGDNPPARMPSSHIHLERFERHSAIDQNQAFQALIKEAFFEDALLTVDVGRIIAGSGLSPVQAYQALQGAGFKQMGKIWVSAGRGIS